ncbi:unnamed protein product [Gordionus sp. m RMFG-2023]
MMLQTSINNSFIFRISGEFEVQGTKHKGNILIHTCQEEPLNICGILEDNGQKTINSKDILGDDLQEELLTQLGDSIVLVSNNVQTNIDKSFILRTSGNFKIQGTTHKVNLLLHTCQDTKTIDTKTISAIDTKTISTTPIVATPFEESLNLCDKIESNELVYSKDVLGADLPNTFPERLQIIKLHRDILIKIDGVDIYDENKKNSISKEDIESIKWLIENQYSLHIKSNLVATMNASMEACPFTIFYLDYNEIKLIEKCYHPLVLGNEMVQNSKDITISQTYKNGKIQKTQLFGAYLTRINGDLDLQGTIYDYIFTIKQCPCNFT